MTEPHFSAPHLILHQAGATAMQWSEHEHVKHPITSVDCGYLCAYSRLPSVLHNLKYLLTQQLHIDNVYNDEGRLRDDQI